MMVQHISLSTEMPFEERLDALEWEALEPAAARARIKPAASITLVKRKRRNSSVLGRACATLYFRDKLFSWIDMNGPLFKVETGGLEFLRLVADQGGRFKAVDGKGTTKRISLGHVNFWPDEARQQTALKFWFRPGWVGLQFPSGFAKPMGCQKQAPAIIPPFLREMGGVQFTRDEVGWLEILLERNMATAAELSAKGASILRLGEKLKPLGITIEPHFGGGLRLDAASKARLRIFLEKSVKKGALE
jgi:hypothetical protein